MSTMAFLSMGPAEWLIVLVIILILFGASRIPDIARSLGRSVSEFKKGMREGQDEDEATKKKAGEEAAAKKKAEEEKKV